MENKEEVPWTWGDGGKPSQPNIHPIDSHAVGTRFLACGYDAEMKPFGVGDWVRYTDYARIKEDLEKSDGVVFKQAVENERLKAEVEAWKDMVAENGVACNERARENQDLENQIERLKAEVEKQSKQAAYICASEETKEEISRLKAEVERLTAFTTRTIIPNEELQAENARLKAKVEKLECDAETSYRESMNDEYDLDWLNKINNGLMKEKEKLQAQVERLTKQNALATPRHLIASQDITSLREQVENSKRINTELLALSNRQASDIRRLTKAGDDIANFLGPCYAVREWNKAKESKQS